MDQSQTLGVMDAIKQRHSVRDFKPDKLDAATIDRLLAAAVRAPTAMHMEPWAFVVVQDTAVLRRLSDCAKTEFERNAQDLPTIRARQARVLLEKPGFNIFYNAGTLLVICAPAAEPFAAADCWLAAENLMLAASALGLGTCVIGFAVTALNTADVKRELGIPPEMTAVAPIIVGVPQSDSPPTARNAPRVLRRIRGVL